MTIVTIAVDSGTIYGLAEDNILYIWNKATKDWERA